MKEADAEAARWRIGQLEYAYQLWNDTRGESVDTWMEMLADDVVLHPPGGHDAGSGFFQGRNGKAAACAYFSALAEEWEMIYFIPEQFIASDDRVVVLSRMSFRSRTTGKTFSSHKIDIFRFRDGEVVEYRDFFDTAGVLAAQRED